jgi:translation initiation factor 2 alpha subunit (eIF-2alpha)
MDKERFVIDVTALDHDDVRDAVAKKIEAEAAVIQAEAAKKQIDVAREKVLYEQRLHDVQLFKKEEAANPRFNDEVLALKTR